ncbi:UbiA family prenyltransferase [Kitasatospora sp. NPDC057223]|uniref:UbiA family prenyltransferase n=1 Tax=Kitasatospora sp. NPDC057223 TaxID=3346055 RepID=UPI0036250858
MALLRLLTAVALCGGPSTAGGLPGLLAGVLGWLCATTFAYLYNGVADADEDGLNESGRPIARGALSSRTALRAAAGFVAVAIAAATVVDVRMVAAVVAVLVLGYIYSAPGLAFKRTSAGAMAVLLLSGSLTYYGGSVIAGSDRQDGPALLILALAMSLWMALVGALVKDFSDVPGDAATGRRTWAIVLGETRTAALAAANALLLGTAFVFAAVRWAPSLLPAALACLLGAGCVAVSLALLPPDGSRERRRVPYRLFMVTQYLVHGTALTTALA